MAGGAGYVPVAPGTAGAALGVLLFLPLSRLAPPLYALTLLALLALGTWAADAAESAFGRKDDGRIVIDEVLGQLVALAPLLALPRETGDWERAGWLVTAFVAFRVFDMAKPGPVRWAERRFAGGAGVMLDDAVAGALGALVLWGPVALWASEAPAAGAAG